MIKGNTENVKLCGLGENRWSSFDVKSIDDHHKKDLTFKHLMNTLTEKERVILANPYSYVMALMTIGLL